MSDEEILEAIDALDAPVRPHDPHGLIWLMKALVTGEDITNHANAKGDPNRRRAFKYLREDELLRNGKRTKAGATAAPILRDLTRLDRHPAKPYARMLLVDLLANDHQMSLTTGLDVGDKKTKRRYARGRGRDILDMLVADADSVIDELEHAEPSTRSSAAFLLGFLSPAADRSFERLVARCEREEEPWVKASLMLAAALVARYRGEALTASDLEAWCADASPIPHALAWVAALYSEPAGGELDAASLTGKRAEGLFNVLASGDPDPRLFPWATGNVERTIAWPLAERGEAASIFAAEVLARASREEVPGFSRCAREALLLCFEQRHPPPPIADCALDPGRRRVVSHLSRRRYGQVHFAGFGLPAAPPDRRRWLGETEPTALDRLIEVDGRPTKLGERLRLICQEILQLDRERRKTRRKSRKKQPPLKSLDRREPVLAELRAHLTGIDLLQALCFLACGAHNLAGRPIKSDDVYPVLAKTRPSAEWIRKTLAMLDEDRGNLRGSGVGMALVAALVRHLPDDELLPESYDELLRLRPPSEAAKVMQHLTQERRDALAVRVLEHDAHVLVGASHWNVEALLELAEHVTADGVADLALEIADQVVEDSFLKLTDPGAADALRERVVARYGDSAAG